jgi:CRISPR-associated exonuclease Cas4
MQRILKLYDRASRIEANGLDFQHAAICGRRCWLHKKRLSLNAWSEEIRRGEILHASSHIRDRSVSGLMGLRPDRLDWNASLVIEEKRSTSYMEAACDQAAFYAVCLTAATSRMWSARLDMSRSKKRIPVPLNEVRLDRLERSMVLIEALCSSSAVPNAARIGACSGCSNAEFCWLGE